MTGVLRRALGRAGRLVLLLGAAWAGGLVWFTLGLDDGKPAPETSTDAIVVLTGGRGRIETGVDLLQAGRAKKLFISGVPPGVPVVEMLHQSAGAEHLAACCIVLGHAADNTIGNAAETVRWLAEEGYRSLRLVTADYHMRRALLEFRRVLPADDLLVPDPVDSGGPRRGLWRATSPAVITEYIKYLGALVRPYLQAERDRRA